ncbi:hypothetical protein GN958_ATG06652 [Phytophthora infestans]|uniref:Uncharacterized protein n=1 Tax=Phytophthora infestans TaxID=4787 RepID=A0A8S9UTW1_PHYIN|nr:hypothetical protein GN958_ATG06652 [Phytophthora infestans]
MEYHAVVILIEESVTTTRDVMTVRGHRVALTIVEDHHVASMVENVPHRWAHTMAMIKVIVEITTDQCRHVTKAMDTSVCHHHERQVAMAQ